MHLGPPTQRLAELPSLGLGDRTALSKSGLHRGAVFIRGDVLSSGSIQNQGTADTLLPRIRTWKKLVCEGSRPVLPAGTVTSMGATRPTRAGAPTCTANPGFTHCSYKTDRW